MLLGHLLISLILGVLLASLMGAARPRRMGSGAPGLFLLALILGVWAGGLWLPPIGPAVFGMYPTPFLLAGLILALAIAVQAAQARRRPAAVQGPREISKTVASDTGPLALGLWFLVVMLTGAIALWYFNAA